ncbi:MAG TPA: hypothetical protein VHT51_09045 [Micropepsaceae bacterium]|jgi:uncharacterized membrane-anchored protein|nr:hypothetical protein [Micropepsaceae bacterium]
MTHIDRNFVAMGLVWLVTGMVLGFYMGARNDNTFLQVHVAMLMGGFVVLTLYGILYRLWPAMKQSPLAKAQFWCAFISAFVIVAGTVERALNGSVALVAAGSALAIVGAILMAWQFVAHAESPLRDSAVAG